MLQWLGTAEGPPHPTETFHATGGMETLQALVPARGYGQQGRNSPLPLPGEGGNWARPGSATHSSLFLRWLNVCFQIPEACVTPTPVPRWPPACLCFLPPLA